MVAVAECGELRRRMANVAVFLDYRGVLLVGGGLSGGICLGMLPLAANGASDIWLDVKWACGWKTKRRMRRCCLVCPFEGVVLRMGFWR